MTTIRKIRNGFSRVSKKTQGTTGALILFALSQFLIKFFGLLKNRFLSSYFGAGVQKDVFDSAFLIPDAIYVIASESIMMFAFFPIFMRLKGESLEKAQKFAGRVLVFLGLLTLILSIFFYANLEFVGRLILQKENFEKHGKDFLTWASYLLPIGIFLSFSNFFSSTLISEKKYIRFALAPLFYNLGTIFGVTVLSKYFGVKGIIFGSLAGAFLHMATQINLSFNFKNIFSKLEKHEKDFLKASLPFFFSTIFIVKAFDFIIANKANQIGSGIYSSYGYAWNIFAIANSLISITVSQAFYADFTKKNFLSSARKAIDLIMFLSIPASFLIFVFRAQLVRIFYGSGDFDWRSTDLTLGHLGALSVGLIFFNLVPILARIFYAKEDVKTPIFANFLSVVALVFGFWIMGNRRDVVAFSASVSFSNLVQFLALSIAFVLRFKEFDSRSVTNEAGKIILGSIIMSISAYAGLNIWAKFLPTDTFVLISLQTIFAGIIGAFAFLISINGLKSENFLFFKKKILSALPSSSSKKI